MKIVCDSCGAKYSIADEKVAGKVFKIRCKKCSDVIVVRGDQVADDGSVGEDPTAIWHVVIEGEQQGPYTPEQFGGMLHQGLVDWETYVWREGFDDWLPAREVGSLVEAVGGGGDADRTQVGPMPEAAQAAPSEAPPSEAPASVPAAAFGSSPAPAPSSYPPAASQPPASQPPAAASSYPPAQAQSPAAQVAQSAPPLSASAPPPAASDFGLPGGQDRTSEQEVADLFANVESSGGFDSGTGVESDPSIAPAPSRSPRVSADEAMTGQRNENSVLFSLSNLQALASGGDEDAGPSTHGPAAAPAQPGHASGEGSGLIDIKSLATSTAPAAGAQSNVDELISIGAGGSTLAGSLGAPTLAPVEEESSSKMPLILAAVGVLALLVIGGVAVAAMSGDDGGDEIASNDNTPQTNAGEPGQNLGNDDTTPANTAGDDTANNTADDTNAGDTNAGETNDDANGQETNDTTADTNDAADTNETPEVQEPVRELTPAERLAEERRRQEELERRQEERERREAEALLNPSSTMMERTSSGDLDTLLDRALNMQATPTRPTREPEPTPPSSNLPELPPRPAVQAALQSVAGRVAACGQGQHGTAMANIVFRGSTGRVASVNISGQFAGTPIGSCAARAVRGARVPRFQRDSMQVSFPYRL